MDDVVDELVRFARRCRRAANVILSPEIKSAIDEVKNACRELGLAWSGSWLGYQARVYTTSLTPKLPGEHFDVEWGRDRLVSETQGEWAEWSHEQIVEILDQRLATQKKALDQLATLSTEGRSIFDTVRREVLPLLDAFLSTQDDGVVRDKRSEIAKLKSHIGAADYAKAIQPRQVMSRDAIAMQEGFVVAPHISYRCLVLQKSSVAGKLEELAVQIEYLASYLKRKHAMKGQSAAKNTGPIFIGHGRSGVWKDLKDFLQDRLDLDYEEFNRVSAAGVSTKERLEEMLDRCCFSFLIMTAEDEAKDGTLHARENVVHEVGLFQGRYGFARAIVLLEDGCAEFSNIVGLGQVRFPKGNIAAVFEEVRKVLERENII